MKTQFFQQNRVRAKVATNNNLLVIAAFQSMQQTNDASAPFVQEANFWWLTGIEEPGWFFIMGLNYPHGCLVGPIIDPVHQTFDGSLPWEEARKISGIDEIISLEEFDTLLADLSKKSKRVMTIGKDPHAKFHDFALNPGPIKLLSKLKKYFKEIDDCRLELAKLRAIKQPDEIRAMKKAMKLTVEAFETIKPTLQPGQYEYQVEADFTHYFRSHGASGHAYSPIVAGGKNACTLHYGRNNDALRQGELLLLDIGAKVGNYSADITRTYAVGKPTKRQQAVHAAVEAAHHEIIGLLKPGLLLTEYLERVDEIMKVALKELDLLKMPQDYRRYFPHAVSHGLGIDVHDALGRPTKFLEGMVLTVEPGIYIPEEGIGVRIEDDILITKTGHENLSAALSTSL